MSALFLNNIELELLSRFNSFGVRYLVIGGHAVQFHGHLRSAKDLDIFVDTFADNPSKVALLENEWVKRHEDLIFGN